MSWCRSKNTSKSERVFSRCKKNALGFNTDMHAEVPYSYFLQGKDLGVKRMQRLGILGSLAFWFARFNARSKVYLCT